MKGKPTTDIKIINKIINSCDVCYVAMVDKDNKPYVLPFNFGYDGTFIYLHSASVGKKIDILKNNNQVCITFSTAHQLFFRNKEVACSYGMKFKSVVLNGKVHFVSEYNEKINILNKIMQKYTGETFNYNAPAVNNVETFFVEIDTVTAKEVGY